MYKKSLVDGSLTTQRYAQWEEHFFNLLQDSIDEILRDPKGWETFTEGYSAKVSKACIKMTLQYALGRKCFNPTQPQLRKAKDKLKNTFEELRHRGEFKNLPLWMQPTIEICTLYIYVRILDLNA